MSHLTYTPEEYREILKADSINTKLPSKENVATTLSDVSKTVSGKTTSLLEAITELILVFFYFIFTGLAILFRSPIPKSWLKIVERLNNSRINRKIENVSENKKEFKKPKYKVVDLDTQKPVTIR